jgi:hypothetical protein
MEPSLKTGNGKATYKTATAAANAAKEARDEAKKATEACRVHQIECDNAKTLCELCAESAIYTCKRDRYWKVVIVGLLLADLATRIFL